MFIRCWFHFQRAPHFATLMVKLTINKFEDPNDVSLRKVEIEVKIPQLMRDRTKAEKCPQLVQVFSECCKREGGLMTFRCRKELNEMKACMERWYTDEQFKQECAQMYLDKRRQFRLGRLKEKLEQQNQEQNKDKIESS